ncbi:MAG TPA: hypothetical protein PLD23_09760 [Armatimonadota bacterium]|nr:hypothetical protein [Armatimonadota bacterium]
MGTSTAHPSPRNPAWQRVRAQYRRAPIDAVRVVSAAAQALDAEFVEAMSAPGVVRCLQAALSVAPGDGSIESAVEAGVRAREVARASLAAQGDSSRQAEIALDATFLTAMALAGSDAARPAGFEPSGAADQDASRWFAAHYLSRLFGHLVARDTADVVGTPGLPDVQARCRLVEAAERVCAEAVRDCPWAGAPQGDPAPLLRGLITGALERLRAAGGPG